MIASAIDGRSFARASGLLALESRRISTRLGITVATRARLTKDALAAATPESQPNPLSTGGPHARDLWQATQAGSMQWAITNSAPYVPFLFTGTQSHWVAPVNAQALRFWNGDSAVFSKGHQVSGIQPNTALLATRDDALLKAQDDLFALGMEETARLARALGGTL